MSLQVLNASERSWGTVAGEIFADAERILPDGWTFQLASGPVPPPGEARWGEHDAVEGRLLSSFDDFATFEIEPSGRTCRIWPGSSAAPETLRHLIFDQIVPRLVAHGGLLVLHAAALWTPAGAILMVGPSGCGKSTLVSSFRYDELELIGDDAIILSNASGSIVCESTYPSLRLNPDSLEALFAVLPPTASVAQYTAKRVVQGLSRREVGPSPLAAIFFIGKPDGDQVSARRMGISDACMALVEQSFSLNPADTQCAQRRLKRSSEVASAIPAFSLAFPREYVRLPAVRECMMDIVHALHGATGR